MYLEESAEKTAEIHAGLLEKVGGTKLGRATIIVPAQSRNIFIDALEKYKINYSRRDVWG